MIKSTLLALALAVFARAQQTVDGQLTVNGQTTKLTQVQAYNTEGFFDKSKDDTIVLLTDRPVTEAQLRDGFALRQLAEDGKLCFVQETINASGQIVNFTLGHVAFKMAPSGGSTEHVFNGRIEARTIAGKVSTRGVQESFGGVKYEYSASFKAPVVPKKK